MVIALAGLAVVNIPVLTEMGLAAAGTVVVAVLIALTLLPALLGFAGKRGAAPQGAGKKPRPDGGRRRQAHAGHPLGALRPAPPGAVLVARRRRPGVARRPGA